MQIEKYIGKISGPLLDRIAVHVSVRAVDPDALRNPGPGESSETIRIRVEQARSRQRHRLRDAGEFSTNALIPESLLREFCAMTNEAEELLFAALRRLTISARGRSHIIRVARTITDLAGDEVIDVNHMAEAIQYRTRHNQ